MAARLRSLLSSAERMAAVTPPSAATADAAYSAVRGISGGSAGRSHCCHPFRRRQEASESCRHHRLVPVVPGDCARSSFVEAATRDCATVTLSGLSTLVVAEARL